MKLFPARAAVGKNSVHQFACIYFLVVYKSILTKQNDLRQLLRGFFCCVCKVPDVTLALKSCFHIRVHISLKQRQNNCSSQSIVLSSKIPHGIIQPRFGGRVDCVGETNMSAIMAKDNLVSVLFH